MIFFLSYFLNRKEAWRAWRMLLWNENIWREWSESHSVVSYSLRPHGLYSSWNAPGQNTGVGSLSLLQEIFPPQGSNPGLPHCRRILYQLSHKGSWLSVIRLRFFDGANLSSSDKRQIRAGEPVVRLEAEDWDVGVGWGYHTEPKTVKVWPPELRGLLETPPANAPHCVDWCT